MEYDKGMTGKGIPKDRPFPYGSGGGPRDQQRRLDRIVHQPEMSVGPVEVIITELRNQVVELNKLLVQKEPVVSGKSGAEFTAEEVDEEIRKAVAAAITETEVKFRNIRSSSEDEVSEKKSKLQNIEATHTTEINKLTTEIIELKEKLDILQKNFSETKNRFDFERKELLVSTEARLVEKDKTVESLRIESEKSGELTKKIEELTMAIASDRDLQLNIDPDRPQMEEVFIDPIDSSKVVDIEPHLSIKDVSHGEKIVMEEKVDKLKSLLGSLPSLK